MKIYTIIGGVNGVGKSSLSGILAEIKSDMGMVVDTNKIIAECGGDKIKGGKIAVKKIDECLSRGITFTQETTLSGVKTLKTVKRAIAQNYF
jgi:predicted ABC-type ATPase